MPPKQQKPKQHWIFFIQWDEMNFSQSVYNSEKEAKKAKENFEKRDLPHYELWIEGPYSTMQQATQRIKLFN